MVSTVLSVSKRGLRDWVIQRLSAIIMAIYTFSLVAYFLYEPHVTFANWKQLFAYEGMKIATLLVLLALLYHAWIGIWTIFTDYVKPFVIRAFLCVLVLLMLASCFFWGVTILWSV